MVEKDLMREQRMKEHRLPDYAPLKNKRNNYGYDPTEQARETYTGMGMDINVHDQWAVESPGAIQDRTREHLGTTDKAIIANRRVLIEAIKTVEQGTTPPFVFTEAAANAITGPATIDGIAGLTDNAQIDEYWRSADDARRKKAAWLPDSAGQAT